MSDMAISRPSRPARRVAWARAFRAMRAATPCSQAESNSGRRIEPARRARTRNTAWNASSAAWSSRSQCRQTPRTIDPCRDTRAAKAASDPPSRRDANRSSSWPSVIPVTEPASSRTRIGLETASDRPPAMTRSPRGSRKERHVSPDTTGQGEIEARDHGRETVVRMGRTSSNLGRQPDPGRRSHSRAMLKVPRPNYGLTTVVTRWNSARSLPKIGPYPITARYWPDSCK